ncbi:MAG: hypothetical protein EOS23_32855 [Mesorhizobium sp.]|uniref:hypothetical protein n=1 Tax=unclassified Mesorhizobium TaxID=325217 RepID=UPI000FD5FD31|nr:MULTISPECIES: hypothetical protein [unclassified Mesorhizobium]RUV31853.1 hypothetical protein EOA86_04840 [Mesorhizobium sp. M5C.F.Ca.IN.020.32.2.1]RWD39693.1 MAG: hypothetical protein EOS59_32290 [Mesorhizobium sp.]RWE05735.1 MAG: hypothetical protein EOS23_32855 [Mesorhizobium sp.]RWE51900.1 MAG: hypothetical protein EOS24_31910 [Mesorhizobium sp.]RWE87433.1 MAG: hypothetical protein EOS49_08345 [Mesorhizobium sp.]
MFELHILKRDHDLSRETLNLPHMMGLPNRTLEPISRSWSFCANNIKANPAQDLAEATILRIALKQVSFGI